MNGGINCHMKIMFVIQVSARTNVSSMEGVIPFSSTNYDTIHRYK